MEQFNSSEAQALSVHTACFPAQLWPGPASSSNQFPGASTGWGQLPVGCLEAAALFGSIAWLCLGHASGFRAKERVLTLLN